jgi:hypothetical protein
MFLEQPLHGISQIQRPPDRFRALKIDWYPQRKKRSAHPSGAQSRKIDVAHIPSFSQILAHHQHALQRVDMAIDPDYAGCQFLRLLEPSSRIELTVSALHG